MDKPRQNKEDKIISDVINNKIKALEEAPPPDLWEKIFSQIKLANMERYEKKPVPWYRSIGFAAAVLLLIGVGSSFLVSNIFYPEEVEKTAYRPLDMLDLEMQESPPDGLATQDGFAAMEEERNEETFLDESESALSDGPMVIAPAEDAPRDIQGFLLRSASKSTGRINATYYLYTKEDKEIWLVVAEYPFTIVGDFPGEEGRFIPEQYMNDINVDTRMNLVRDNKDNHAIIWVYEDAMFILWAKSDNLGRKDLSDLRRFWR